MQHVPTPTGTKEEVKDTQTRRTTIKEVEDGGISQE
jgi:hypothetical protein